MKKMICFVALFALTLISVAEVSAEIPDYSSVSNADNPSPGADNSRLGYLSWGIQSPASFGGNERSYSSPGVSLALMFHDRPLDHKGTPNPNEPSIGDVGLE